VTTINVGEGDGEMPSPVVWRDLSTSGSLSSVALGYAALMYNNSSQDNITIGTSAGLPQASQWIPMNLGSHP